MKCFRKMLSLILALIMVFTIQLPVFATDRINEKESEMLEKVVDLLVGVEENKDTFGMGNVNFTNLYLGNQIPAYIMGENIQAAEVKYYPIIEGELIVAIICAMEDDSGEITVQIGKDFADQLTAFIADNSAVAVLFSENQTVLISPDKANVVNVNEPIMAIDDGSIDVSSIKNKIEYAQISVMQPIVMYPMMRQARATSILDVPYIRQNGPYCWAATLISIGQFYTGSNNGWSAPALAIDYLGTSHKDDGVGIAYVPALFRNYFNLDTKNYYSTISYNDFKNYIYARTPLYASCKNQDWDGHAVVLCGFSDSTTSIGTLYYMDGNYGIRTSTIPYDGSYTIELNGKIFSMMSFNVKK